LRQGITFARISGRKFQACGVSRYGKAQSQAAPSLFLMMLEPLSTLFPNGDDSGFLDSVVPNCTIFIIFFNDVQAHSLSSRYTMLDNFRRPIMMDYADTIKDFIETEMINKKGGGSLSPSDSLIEKGIIDSLGVQILIGYLEKEFGIQIVDHEIVPENFESVRSVADFVNQKLSASA
jgi:acyl carrier protein